MREQAEIIGICAEYFNTHQEAEIVYLFGSYADGTAGQSSDIDLAVLYKGTLSPEIIRGAFLRDWAQVSKALKTDNVDLVCLNDTRSIELKFAITQDGKVVLDRSDFRLDLESRIKTEYFDHLSILKRVGYI